MSFFDTGSRAILVQVFTKLNCVVPVGLGFLPFLIKAVTLFLLIVRLFECRAGCVLHRVLPSLWSL